MTVQDQLHKLINALGAETWAGAMELARAVNARPVRASEGPKMPGNTSETPAGPQTPAEGRFPARQGVDPHDPEQCAKLLLALERGGYGVMKTSGPWHVFPADVDRVPDEDAQTRLVSENIDLLLAVHEAIQGLRDAVEIINTVTDRNPPGLREATELLDKLSKQYETTKVTEKTWRENLIKLALRAKVYAELYAKQAYQICATYGVTERSSIHVQADAASDLAMAIETGLSPIGVKAGTVPAQDVVVEAPPAQLMYRDVIQSMTDANTADAYRVNRPGDCTASVSVRTDHADMPAVLATDAGRAVELYYRPCESIDRAGRDQPDVFVRRVHGRTYYGRVAGSTIKCDDPALPYPVKLTPHPSGVFPAHTVPWRPGRTLPWRLDKFRAWVASIDAFFESQERDEVL